MRDSARISEGIRKPRGERSTGPRPQESGAQLRLNCEAVKRVRKTRRVSLIMSGE